MSADPKLDIGTESKKSSGFFSETFSVIFQALLLAVVLRTLLFQPFSIPSGSMMPNLLIGDYLFVSKFSYGYSRYSIPFAPDLFRGRIWEGKPERGDIAVFKLPSNPEIDYIKRVVGVPGDKIQMVDGVLQINGAPVPKVPNGEFVDTRTATNTKVPMYKETLSNGVTFDTLDINPNGLGDNTRVFEVPAGHYFMMGDNRDNSADSRFEVGFVPLENFVGKASIIFFSIGDGAHPLAVWRWPDALRASRLFQGL